MLSLLIVREYYLTSLYITVKQNFKECSRGFIPLTAKIQQQRINIERYAELHPDCSPPYLAKEGIIEGAPDGKKALSKLGEKYYSVIITDVGMPLMNGIEFYKRASKIYPHIRKRILFYTALDDEGSVSFFKENNLAYLIKPGEINELRKTVGNILNR